MHDLRRKHMSKIPVSVCIIAKNEEKYIEECLKRLKPYGFEIIVTDTGSTDSTREIARKYADKVLDFEWVRDFSAARNYCAAHASNDWIFAVDCDEYIGNVDMKGIQMLMKRYPDYIGLLRRKDILINSDGRRKYVTDDAARLYNRKLYTFINPIHEQLCPIDVSKRDELVKWFLLPMEAIHYGYAIEGEELINKQKRNHELLFEMLEKEPDNPYLYFQIAQSYFAIEDYDKVIEYCEKGLSYNPTTNVIYVHEMIIYLAKAYVFTGRKEDALNLMNKYQKLCNSAKFVYAHANVMVDNNQLAKALLMYIKASSMQDAETLGDNLLSCYEHIIAIYQAVGNNEMADNFTDKYLACRKERERVINA